MVPAPSRPPRPDRSSRTAVTAALAAAVAALPVDSTEVSTAPTSTAPSPTASRLWVQTLAMEGLLLGAYEGVHDFDDDEWEGLLEALSRYGEGSTPRSGRPSAPVALDMDLFRDPDRPLLDAVLAIVLAEGLGGLTLERVAEVSERSVSFLVSAFGTVDELLHDVLEQAYGDGFDDLTPQQEDITERSVTESLAVFESPRQIASMWRVLVLTGVAAPPHVHEQVAASHREVRAALPSPADDPEAWIVPLALDGWALASTMEGYAWAEAVPAGVRGELAWMLDA